MILPVFITVISDHDKPQPPGCLLEAESSSFNKILTDLRMKAAMDMLVEKHESINIVSSAVGFSSTSYFIKIFKDFFGVTPKQMILFLKKNVYYK